MPLRMTGPGRQRALMRSYASAVPAPVHAPPRPTSFPGVLPSRPKGPRRRRWWWLPGIVLIAGGAAYFLPVSSNRPKTQAAGMRTVTARRGTLEQTIRLSGVTVAQKFATLLVPELWGVRASGLSDFVQIIEKLAPPGSHVHKDEIVAEFDRLYMLNRLDDYRAWVSQHRANLRNLYARLDVKRQAYQQQIRRAKSDMDKSALDLEKAPVLSAIRIENLRLTLEENRARYQQIVAEAKYVETSEQAAIRGTELDLQRCDIEFNRAQRNVDRMVVAAPIDGMVVMQSIRRGSELAEIQQGDQLYPGQPYMQIVDLASMAVEASLNQVDAERVRIGQRARVHFDAYPSLELPAHVTAVTAFARSRGWRGSYVTDIPVRLKLDRMDARVLPNFTVSVDLVLAGSEEAVIVPRAGVFDEDGKPCVYAQAAGGFERREVELGMSNNVAAVVTSGLREGEVVAAERPAHAIVP
jgi:HlyD family secretion protein